MVVASLFLAFFAVYALGSNLLCVGLCLSWSVWTDFRHGCFQFPPKFVVLACFLLCRACTIRDLFLFDGADDR